MIEIKTVVDHERGCGWRKEGGLYLMSNGISVPCGKLPVPLTICPCCSAGIKPSRGWTWFNPRPFIEPAVCGASVKLCNGCILSTPPEKAGLLWIGEKFYKSPEDWTSEAMKLGASRRVSMIPKEFEVGKTWIFNAHRKGVDVSIAGSGEEKWQAAIFHVWRPDRIEYVCRGDESQEELEALVKRGITPVKVKRANELDLSPGPEK